jgi:hypothetical protein
MSDFQEITDITNRLRWRQQQRETERRRARFDSHGRYKPRDSRNEYIASQAIRCESLSGGVEFWITYNGNREQWLHMRKDPRLSAMPELMKHMAPEALNGYVAFPKRRAPRLPPGTGNIVQYIPVHGGVTWAHKDSFAAVWGFDTGHAGSEDEPRTDQDWILGNCFVLYRGLTLAAKLWPEFRRAGQKRRAALAQELLDLIPEQPLNQKLGFEALLNTLSGEVG